MWKLACNAAIACAGNTCIHLQVPTKAGPNASERPNAPDTFREETPVARCTREEDELEDVSLNPTGKCRKRRCSRRRGNSGRRRNGLGSTRAEIATRHLEPR